MHNTHTSTQYNTPVHIFLLQMTPVSLPTPPANVVLNGQLRPVGSAVHSSLWDCLPGSARQLQTHPHRVSLESSGKAEDPRKGLEEKGGMPPKSASQSGIAKNTIECCLNILRTTLIDSRRQQSCLNIPVTKWGASDMVTVPASSPAQSSLFPYLDLTSPRTVDKRRKRTRDRVQRAELLLCLEETKFSSWQHRLLNTEPGFAP